MSVEIQISFLRRKYDEKKEHDRLSTEEFLLLIVKKLEGNVVYLRSRLEVERLDREEAVRRRKMLYPTVLAFESDPEFSGE